MYIEGDYLDGITSRRTNARLEVISNGHHAVRIHVAKYPDEAHQKIDLEYAELKIESRLGNTPREIAFGQDQLFVTDDNDAIDALIKAHSESKAPVSVHQLERNSLLIFLGVIVTAIMVWMTVLYGIPKSAEYIAFQLPEFATDKLGGSLAILDETLFEPSELEISRQQEIRSLVAPYLAAYQALHPKLEFRAGMMANAFALPGGEIVLTDGLVNLVEDDRELLAVLFHELGHLQHRHITRRALQGSMATILFILVVGDTIDTVEFLAALPTLLLDFSYSRAFEKEADDFALEQLHRFDIPVDYFAIIMQRLEGFYLEPGEGSSEEGLAIEEEVSQKRKLINDFLSTHPSTGDRVRLVDQFKRARGID